MVYLPPTFPADLHDAVLNFLEPLGLDAREWHPPIPNVIKFVRKVQVEWDPEGLLFRPCEEKREEEKWIVLWMSGLEFVELVFDSTGVKLDLFIRRLKRCIQGAEPIIIVEGLAKEIKKQKTAEKRAHDRAVRGQLGNERAKVARNETPSTQGLLKIDEEVLENALIEIQLQHEVRVVHTDKTPDSAEWISILATDIATIPYR